ncbi:MAG: tetratricopeptide repeat protein, partial [Cyanobacteria bacterium P01_A01_bin.137]
MELQIEERQKTLSDTVEWFEDERLAGWMLDLVHHYGWRGEEVLWEYLVPRFIEAWQYDRTWAKSLLQVVKTFRQLLAAKQRKILDRMQAAIDTKPDLREQTVLLETLEKWLMQQSLDAAKTQELQALLKLQHGYLCFAKDQYDDALDIGLAMVSSYPAVLRVSLAKLLRQLAWKFSWKKGSAIASEQGKLAAQRATELDEKDAANWVSLGVVHHGLKQNESAIEALQKGLKISEEAYAVNWLGATYKALKRYDEAISSYEKAIELDPSYATAHNNLGATYNDLKRYDEAISSYEKAIELDPSYATAHNNLGITYKAL